MTPLNKVSRDGHERLRQAVKHHSHMAACLQLSALLNNISSNKNRPWQLHSRCFTRDSSNAVKVREHQISHQLLRSNTR